MHFASSPLGLNYFTATAYVLSQYSWFLTSAVHFRHRVEQFSFSTHRNPQLPLPWTDELIAVRTRDHQLFSTAAGRYFQRTSAIRSTFCIWREFAPKRSACATPCAQLLVDSAGRSSVFRWTEPPHLAPGTCGTSQYSEIQHSVHLESSRFPPLTVDMLAQQDSLSVFPHLSRLIHRLTVSTVEL